ncbi:thiamine phosphate synthase [Aquimarina sp. I32.4]|uniref:thiamine phosphate synthase n=1 Tax=Aquimarina sp. I32.4 TaxID=2053903 RepID=UPI000CDF10A2|nr:thiamine phosphate synthase [Aquimarina sp. I32.4]
MIEFQYISQGETPQEHLYNIEEVCKNGGKWIQLRIKNEERITHLKTAMRCRDICDQYGAIMVVNDSISVAKVAMADGVHLGLNDTSPEEARKILGDNFIIGGTANTIEDCIQQIRAGVDYIGLGPYKYTNTKKNLSPVLGLEGYKNIIEELHGKNIEIPVVAIGGITEADIPDLIKTKVTGVAVSGMLTRQENLEQKIKNIKKNIPQRLVNNSFK